MEPEHPENESDDAGTVDDEEAACNQLESGKISRKSIIF